MTNLFEYQNSAEFSKHHLDDLEIFLDAIWAKREKSSYYFNEEDNRVEQQRFIQFLHKTKTLKSNKYVGVIHFEGETINLLPKIFYKNEDATKQDVNAINKHILWWLSYCRKLKFPNYLSGLNSEKADFFEILIYLFSKYTRELLNSSIYQQYTEVNKELSFVKGRIDFDSYIAHNLSRGRHHKISCSFDAFEMDNDFNRCVKFVSKLLLSTTKENQSRRFLNDILFILDEVKDVSMSSDQMKRMSFNPMFSDFETIRDYCILFLDNSVSFNYKNDLKLFAFLLPMEYVFEDFIFGFIDKEIDAITAKAQDMSKYLAEGNRFQLKPDLLLEFNEKRIIADTKYKVVYADETDTKNGITQSDLYQMLSYAVRFKVNEIVLFYPNTIKTEVTNNSEFTIVDELADNEKVIISSFQLPIINFEMFREGYESDKSLSFEFEAVKRSLVEQIEKALEI
ncbi:McrC family protein [Winogradskyella psychrotolerans]|uniref:McrC family protein n=1 Tax=Winogradskyella psychrotolerans TaxID=1344585 RepID=UPI001C077030|nr:McrC family protein [Winogradskyella psychrotolerans]MBU2929445.1 McrC family protein [Winogradskyella psychrotolerans]